MFGKNKKVFPKILVFYSYIYVDMTGERAPEREEMEREIIWYKPILSDKDIRDVEKEVQRLDDAASCIDSLEEIRVEGWRSLP